MNLGSSVYSLSRPDQRIAKAQRSNQAPRSGPSSLPSRKVLSLEVLNEPLFDFMRLVEFRGRFLNVGNRAVPS
jgi:hypothetical protein